MFNPKARWDRELPQNNSNLLNEKISVYAVFDQGRIFPRYFIWNNYRYKVKQITYFWQERKGEALFSIFSLETNCGLYQISFDNKNFVWKLDKVID